MTKDDLPPPLDHWTDYTPLGFNDAQDYALAAIAAHDAKRERVLMWREGPHRFYMECKENLNDGVGEYAWAYIEREGA